MLLLGVGVSYAQFNGGSAGGASSLNVTNSACSATGPNPFAGGSASGAASLAVSSGACSPTPLNAFSGGSSSGFSSISVSNSACSAMPLNAFTGGSSAGFASVSVSNSACSAMPLNAFTGGSASGSASVGVSNSSCSPAPLNAFSGGAAQGAATVGVSNSSCSPAPLNAFGGGSAQGAASLGVANSACSPAPLNAFAGGSAGGSATVEVVNSACDPVTLNAFAGGSSAGFAHIAEIALDQSTCVSLPIELLSFQAVLQDGEVLLTWETLTEINNDFFTVQRSGNGVDFVAITAVKGAGDSDELQTYQVVDPNPLPGMSYYRLGQTDYDGTEAHSHLVIIENMPEQIHGELHPNPVTGDVAFITFNQPIANETQLQLHDLTGRKLSGITWCVEDSRRLQVNVDDLAQGVYVLQVSWGRLSQQWKIVIE